VFVVDTKAKFCICSGFVVEAICKHLIAATLVDGVDLYGIKEQLQSLRTLRRRKKPTEHDESSIEDDIDDEPVDEDDEHANDEDIETEVQ
jgi:hypothetical protein